MHIFYFLLYNFNIHASNIHFITYVGFALLFIGGILGALLGHKMLKKHFERAGIV